MRETLLEAYQKAVESSKWNHVEVSENVKVLDRLGESLEDGDKTFINENKEDKLLSGARFLVRVNENLTVTAHTQEDADNLVKLLENASKVKTSRLGEDVPTFIDYNDFELVKEAKKAAEMKEMDDEEDDDEDKEKDEMKDVEESEETKKVYDEFINDAVKMAVSGYMSDLKSASVTGQKVELKRFQEMVKNNLKSNKERAKELEEKSAGIVKMAMAELSKHDQYAELKQFISGHDL